MARDINFTIHTGELTSEPKIHVLKNSKKILTFTLRVTEKFELADGSPGAHTNFFTFEALGRHADTYFRELVIGRRYQINGYLRHDNIGGVDKVRIRCFNIQTAD